jgi:hypothetical protein
MKNQTQEHKEYRSELKNQAKTLRKNGYTMNEIAKQFTEEKKPKLSGAKTSWANSDVAYLFYKAPNGTKRVTKAATSTPISDQEELLREALNSNMNVNAKIKLMKVLLHERSN